MAPRLLSRDKWIPYGFRFQQPEINWIAPRNISFDSLVRSIIAARLANPVQMAKHGWSTDYNHVAREADEFNARLCQSHGWKEYIMQSSHPVDPKFHPLNQSAVLQSLRDAAARAKELVQGAKTLVEWIDSGDSPVPQELAERRAAVCLQCPKNEPGDFTKWFTTPAAELIRRQVLRSQARSMTTAHDEKLNLCTACHCPLKLKVHVPIEWITKRLTDQQKAGLAQGKDCWILAESRAV